MIFSFRSVAIAIASAGYAHAALGGDEKAATVLISSIPASAWASPSRLNTTPPMSAQAGPMRASFVPALPSSFFGDSNGTSRLLFLSPFSPLRAALRVATHDLAAQTLTTVDVSAILEAPPDAAAAGRDASRTTGNTSEASRRREVLLRQRRKSALNDRDKDAARTEAAEALESNLELSGFSGRVDLLTLPSGVQSPAATQGSIPNGAGLVTLSGYLRDDLSFALTGLAADSAATTWRAGAEFELAAGDRNRTEIGAVYGARFNAANAPIGGEVDRRTVGAFRLVHAVQILDGVSARAGGRVIDAPFLRSSRSVDPEFSVLLESPDRDGGRSYVRLDLSGDTLFPGLEVVAGESDVIALSEGLSFLPRNFKAQRTWNRAVAVGYKEQGTRLEARLQDQTVADALFVLPSAVAGAPYVENGRRGRLQFGSLMLEKTFAHSQVQTGVEYGYGRFAEDQGHPGQARDFHQLTTRFDAYVRRSGTGLALFHRLHEGAAVTGYEGETRPRERAHRYLVELRQDVPFVPAMIGADMALLVSLRNVYYDDVDRRNIDEFAVKAPPRRVTGGIRVKF